jgi:hypothetical protein
MRKMTTAINNGKHVGYDWKIDLIAVGLAALVVILFVAEWFYWTRAQLGH